MADFIIPKNQAFDFRIEVKEANTFIAQNLDACISATMSVIPILDPDTTTYTISLGIPTPLSPDSQNGVLTGYISEVASKAVNTNTGFVTERATKADGYYLKPTYQGVIIVTFSDGTPTISTILDKIYVISTGA